MKLIYLEFYIKNYRKITVLYLLVNVVSQKQKSLISYLVFDYKFLIVFSFFNYVLSQTTSHNMGHSK